MFEHGNNLGVSGEKKGTLVARVDERVVPALDRVANTNEVNATQLMSRFFSDITDAVQFLDSTEGGSWTTIEDWFAKLIIEQSHGITPETLQAVGHIWYRAADILSMEKGG